MFLGSTTSGHSRGAGRVWLSAVSITVLLLFSGCSNLNPIELFTTTVEIDRPDERPALPNPKPIETSPFKWRVITPDRLPEGGGWVYYGITPKSYEVLARNMADILRWVKEAKWRLDYYRGEGLFDGDGISAEIDGAEGGVSSD